MSTTICLSFDFDAVSLWIGTWKSTTPTPISRGEYGARVGIYRILALLRARDIPATFFVPGHTAETFPEAVRAIADAHHEIGAHGYLHESPVGLSWEEEAMLLTRAEQALERTTGQHPVGYRSPVWDLGSHTIDLLVERGYVYDSSLMGDDFLPYHPRRGDRIEPDGRMVFGEEAPLVEFPVAWELDDYPYFHFGVRPFNPGLRRPEEVFEIWAAEFEYCCTRVPNGVFTVTMHPQIIGRGSRIAMLDRLILTMRERPGVQFATMGEAARAWKG